MKFFVIQATTECTFTLKCTRDIVRTQRHKSLFLTKNAYNFTSTDTLQRFPNKIGGVSKVILNNTLTIKPGFFNPYKVLAKRYDTSRFVYDLLTVQNSKITQKLAKKCLKSFLLGPKLHHTKIEFNAKFATAIHMAKMKLKQCKRQNKTFLTYKVPYFANFNV